jgi:5-formyltetrahydrofolate cyclo-ligase
VDFTEDKKTIRKAALELRSRYAPEKKRLFEREISSRLMESGIIHTADRVLSYVSKDFEVYTADIIKSCLANSVKTLAVPRVSGSDIDFYVIRTIDDLEPGRFGINEPKAHCKPLEAYHNCICITPGLVFTESGYRLGYGGGYYDRFFKKHPEVIKIGLIFEEFLYADNAFTPDSFDIPADIIITERRILDVRQ